MLSIFNLKKSSSKEKTSLKEGITVKEERHHLPITKEWFNGVYSYNKSVFKLLPSIDISVIRLIRRYFYMFSRTLEIGIHARRMRARRRKYRTDKTLVAKPEFKHTNDKVTITLYIYNRYLYNNIRKMNKVSKNNTEKRLVIFKKFLHEITKGYKTQINSLINVFDKQNISNIKNILLTRLVVKYLKQEKLLLNYKKMINFNNYKFNSVYILPLKKFLEKIYKKEVDFNLVSLKSYHLNTDILMQILAIKLKNRKTNAVRVMQNAFALVRLPYRTRLEYFSEIPSVSTVQNMYFKKNLNKNYIYTYPTMKSLTKNSFNFSNILMKKIKNDKLDMMLKSLLPKEYTITSRSYKDKQPDIPTAMPVDVRKTENSVLDSIKHKTVNGIRIKASGRLTKRIIAARSVTKIRQIGTIRNIDSSYKGLSSVVLRGSLKSNVQFSKTKNKSRIGSYGLKGWISSI